ncbi:MAG: GntR family transcriptional regulator [Cellulosilyticaceae bacterium]
MDTNRLNDMALSEKTKIAILKYINGMDLKKSNKLPREEALAEIIGVSRVTIRSALNDLSSEGTIFRRQGKGTFVNVDSLNIKVKFNPVIEFTQMIRGSGFTPSVKVLNIEIIPPNPKIAAVLQLPSEEKIVMAEKMFFADGKMCAFCSDYFALSAIGGEEGVSAFEQHGESIFEYIYQHSGRRTLWDKVEIDTALSNAIPNLKTYTDLKKLGVKPFLLLKGVNYDLEDKPLIYTMEYIDTSIICFSMIRQKNIKY